MEKTRKVADTKNGFAPEIEDEILYYSLHNLPHPQGTWPFLRPKQVLQLF
jgi:hypothetical protein